MQSPDSGHVPHRLSVAEAEEVVLIRRRYTTYPTGVGVIISTIASASRSADCPAREEKTAGERKESEKEDHGRPLWTPHAAQLRADFQFIIVVSIDI